MKWLKKQTPIDNKKNKNLEDFLLINGGFFEKGTKSTPEIYFQEDGNCSIVGISIPETLDELYKSAKEFLSGLINKGIIINFTFDYTYFNTCTQRYNYDLLEELNKQPIKGKTIWKVYNDDEDSLDMGNIYKLAFPDLDIKIKD